MASTPTEEERRKLQLAAIAAFPFQRTEVPGDRALATWQQLKATGRGAPVVLGGDDDVERLMDVLDPAEQGWRAAEEILAAASGIRHPGDWVARLAEERARERERLLADTPAEGLSNSFVQDASGQIRQLTNAEIRAMMLAEPHQPPDGEWPSEVPLSPGLSVATDTTDQPLPKVHIAIIPTDDWTTVPAYLNWGGWNDCPDPEYHVAALRSWRDRFGAELVGLSFDTTNLRVARRPATREAALELAREHYLFCNDIVEQGTDTLNGLAAYLAADDWWFFWWD
jgi:hypothetical protein